MFSVCLFVSVYVHPEQFASKRDILEPNGENFTKL